MPEAKAGDYVIVHVGFALSVVDAGEAEKVFCLLRQMDELGELRRPAERTNEIHRRIPGRRGRAAHGRRSAEDRHETLDPDGALRRPDPTPSCAWAWTNCCSTGSLWCARAGVPGPCVTPVELIDKALGRRGAAGSDFTSFAKCCACRDRAISFFIRQGRGRRIVRAVYSRLETR